jgi:hypothetical protein
MRLIAFLQGWDLLRQRMLRPDLPVRQIMLSAALVIRDSTGRGPVSPSSAS